MEHEHEPRWFRNTCACGHRITDDERREIVARHMADLGRALREDAILGRIHRLMYAMLGRLEARLRRSRWLLKILRVPEK